MDRAQPATQKPRGRRVTALIPGLVLAAARLTVLLMLVVVTYVGLRLTLWVALGAGGRARSRIGLAFLGRFLRVAAALLGVEVRIQGRCPPRGSLIVANHRSYFDILALGAATPCLFLAKAEIGAWPFFGAGARAIGIPLVARRVRESRRRAADQILERLSAGISVVNFPEGTTSSCSAPRAFKPGLFHRVAGERVAVVPVTIRYEGTETDWVGDATFVDHLFRAVMRLQTRIDLVFSPPLRAEQFSSGKRLCLVAHDRVCRPAPEGPGEHEIRPRAAV